MVVIFIPRGEELVASVVSMGQVVPPDRNPPAFLPTFENFDNYNKKDIVNLFATMEITDFEIKTRTTKREMIEYLVEHWDDCLLAYTRSYFGFGSSSESGEGEQDETIAPSDINIGTKEEKEDDTVVSDALKAGGSEENWVWSTDDETKYQTLKALNSGAFGVDTDILMTLQAKRDRVLGNTENDEPVGVVPVLRDEQSDSSDSGSPASSDATAQFEKYTQMEKHYEEKRQTFTATLSEMDGKVITLCDGDALGELKLKVIGIDKEVVITFGYGLYTLAKEIFDYIDQMSEDIVGQYVIKWSTDQGASVLIPRDCLYTHFDTQGRTLYLAPKALGGGKRAKKTSMTESNLKELKQSVNEALGTMKAMRGVAPIVVETLTKIDALMQGVGTGGGGHIRTLLATMPVERLAKVASSTLTSSTRPFERCQFVCEALMTETFEGLDEVQRQGELSQVALAKSVQYAIQTEYLDHQTGGISWQRFLEDATKAMTNRPAEAQDAGRCNLM
eukprot:s1367_g1.t1